MKSFSRRHLLIFTRLVLGTIFIAASLDKIAHPAEFAKIVYNYQLLPDSMVNGAAIVLPWLEALLGVLLVAGLWLPGAAVLANVLLLAFFSALLYNFARGLNVHCGCFTTQAAGTPPTMAWNIVRDSLFLALGMGLLVQVVRDR
jgi:uncharacterized membrane protein YphA (DoxX/SURF4 family)